MSNMICEIWLVIFSINYLPIYSHIPEMKHVNRAKHKKLPHWKIWYTGRRHFELGRSESSSSLSSGCEKRCGVLWCVVCGVVWLWCDCDYDVMWCGVMWCDMWCDVMMWWFDVVGCGVMWYMMWCDVVMWCDDVMMWCDVMWYDH